MVFINGPIKLSDKVVTEKSKNLVLASCWETSKRVLICSETTPKAKNAAHARPAPRPNRRVRDVATQSVDSTLVAGLMGLWLCALRGTGSGCCSDEGATLDCGCEGGVGCFDGGGGGVGADCGEDEKCGVRVMGWGRHGQEPKKVAIFLLGWSFWR